MTQVVKPWLTLAGVCQHFNLGLYSRDFYLQDIVLSHPPLTNRSSIWEENKLLSLSERLVIGDIRFISVVHKGVEAAAQDRIY
jgi:hypothetical protein